MRFEIYRDKAGDWRWRFIASNGKIICCSSEGYRRERSVRYSLNLLIEALRKGPPPRIEVKR